MYLRKKTTKETPVQKFLKTSAYTQYPTVSQLNKCKKSWHVWGGGGYFV